VSGERIQCPHCAVATAVDFEALGAQRMRQREEGGGVWYRADYGYCQSSECGRLVMRVITEEDGKEETEEFVVPRGRARSDTRHVPAGILSDYEEACAVLHLSPAASAALARRCLQGVIHGHFEIHGDRLYDEIKKVAGLMTLPPHLAEGLDRVREIGNLAAHPTHEAKFGVVANVSREEARWTLEILESLFKHCYVEPREYERRTRKLRTKLDKAKGQAKNHDQATQGESPR